MRYVGKMKNDALAERRKQYQMGFNKFDLHSLDVIFEVTEWNFLDTLEMLFSLTCAMITIFKPNSIPFVLPLP